MKPADRTKNIDMTNGPILGELVSFTMPLVFGNIFQLAYNMVDTIVLGRFAGNTALAAVGTCDPVMSLLILGISGVCVGASILMSRFYGAGDLEKLNNELKTTMALGLFTALVIMGAGFVACRLILTLLKVPSTVMPEAMVYLRIIFLGMPFTCVYNIYAAALRSVGDSKTPLRYLIISNLLNMGLDLILVGLLHLGVAGAGAATVLAEGISAVLCVIFVSRYVPLLHFSFRELAKPDKNLAKQTLAFGGVTALQQCAQPVGNLMIQGTVNTLSVASIAAFNAVRKIEDIGLVPGRSVGNAIQTFAAQNEGAAKHERSEDGYRKCFFLEVMTSLIVCLIVFSLKKPLMRLFTDDKEIIKEGLSYYAVMAWAYWLPSINNGRQGYLRGMGAVKASLMGTISQISFRVLFTILLVPKIGIAGIGYACIFGWCVQGVWQEIFRIRLNIKVRRQYSKTIDSH